MKKRISVLLATVLAISCLATACGGTETATGAVKVGVGVHTDFAYGSKDVSDKNGVAQADLHIAAVMVDKDGKIIDVEIDAVQIAAEIDATGKIVTDRKTTYQTKNEKGMDYGMVKWGSTPIGKEWFEQVNYFEQYCIGKTIDEINNISLVDETATDKTILAGCTIKILGIQKAVVRAMENAKWEGASATDTLGLGIESSIDDYNYTYDATAEKDGMVCATAHFVATTTDKDGKITCVVLDAVQAKSTFSADGKITTDMTKEPISKYNQGMDYGMVKYNSTPIGKEWFEQAEFFMQTVKATNAAIAESESGAPSDKTVLAGCTIVVTDMNAALEKALHPAYTH